MAERPSEVARTLHAAWLQGGRRRAARRQHLAGGRGVSGGTGAAWPAPHLAELLQHGAVGHLAVGLPHDGVVQVGVKGGAHACGGPSSGRNQARHMTPGQRKCRQCRGFPGAAQHGRQARHTEQPQARPPSQRLALQPGMLACAAAAFTRAGGAAHPGWPPGPGRGTAPPSACTAPGTRRQRASPPPSPASAASWPAQSCPPAGRAWCASLVGRVGAGRPPAGGPTAPHRPAAVLAVAGQQRPV